MRLNEPYRGAMDTADGETDLSILLHRPSRQPQLQPRQGSSYVFDGWPTRCTDVWELRVVSLRRKLTTRKNPGGVCETSRPD